MARFLFVVPPLTGHVNPTVPVGQILMNRGHSVAWVGYESFIRPLLFPGAEILGLKEKVSEEDLKALKEHFSRARGILAMKLLWEDFLVPLGRNMYPGVMAAVDQFRPDVLISDQQALAGAVTARKRGLPWATFTTSAAGVVENPLPLVWKWVLDQLAILQREAQLPVIVERPDISPQMMVVFCTELQISMTDFPSHYYFVGPSFDARIQNVNFPWERLRWDIPRVLVSLGTVNAERGAAFYQKLVNVMKDEPVQVILSAPEGISIDFPDNFIVQNYLPQLALLKKINAVVCHAGQNTVSETLAHGLPLVVIPIDHDQGLVATQVVASGAGRRVRWGRLQAGELKSAIKDVLENDDYRVAARRIQRSFEKAGGAKRAAELVETLVSKNI